jgi:hypothetical protein
MSLEKQQIIKYQFVLINYDTPFDLVSKVHSLILNYNDLEVMDFSQLFAIDPSHFKNGNELYFGDLIPILVQDPVFLDYEMTKEMNPLQMCRTILNDLFNQLDNGIDKKNLVVRMIHKW